MSPRRPTLLDGRAGSIDEAIQSHTGEASACVGRYARLPTEERDALLAFVRTL